MLHEIKKTLFCVTSNKGLKVESSDSAKKKKKNAQNMMLFMLKFKNHENVLLQYTQIGILKTTGTQKELYQAMHQEISNISPTC